MKNFYELESNIIYELTDIVMDMPVSSQKDFFRRIKFLSGKEIEDRCEHLLYYYEELLNEPNYDFRGKFCRYAYLNEEYYKLIDKNIKLKLSNM